MWQEKDEKLYRQFKFADFRQAFDFMTEVAAEAERMKHHPRWQNEYNKVTIWLSTHSDNAITEKDRQLASKIEKIYEKYD